MSKELYVMGLLPEQIKMQFLKYQEHLSQTYNLYDGYCPELHITLGKIDYDDTGSIKLLISNLYTALENVKPVRININGTSCFGPPYKSVNLNVDPSPELKRLSDIIADTARASGLAARDQSEGWQYHISIANPAFAKNEWSESEYNEACELMKKEYLHISFILNQIQLWRPVEKDYVVHGFMLK